MASTPTVGAYIRSLKEHLRAVDAYLQTTEQQVIAEWPTLGDFPTGRRRYEHPQWAIMIKDALEDTSTPFEAYAAWCEAGLGEEILLES